MCEKDCINSDEVVTEEKEALGRDNEYQPAGIAISGGGIRSASFSIGVLQALQQCKLEGPLKRVSSSEPDNDKKPQEGSDVPLFCSFDYLSTVSGGGYTGTSLSWFKHKNGWDFFPFGIKGQGARGIRGETDKQIPYPAKILTFIRLHSDYLTPTGWLDFISMLGTLIKGMLISASFYFLFLVLCVATLYSLSYLVAELLLYMDKSLVKCICSFINHLLTGIGRECIIHPEDQQFIMLGVILSGLSLLAFLGMTFIPLLFGIFKVSKSSIFILWYRWRTRAQVLIGIFIKGFLLGVLIISLPIAYRLLAKAMTVTGPVGVVIGLITAYTRFRTVIGKLPFLKSKPRAGTFIFVLCAAIFIYVLFVLSYGIVIHEIFPYGEFTNSCKWPIYYILVAVFIVYGLLVNINYCAVGRMYRDRLTETFLPDKDSIENDVWGLAKEAEQTPLDEFCLKVKGGKTTAVRPYQLINSNVVLVSDDNVRNRDRGGASFLLSSLFVGSNATGYMRTKEYMKKVFGLEGGWQERHGIKYRGLTGATAMAISGAAVNPDTGVAGGGPTRNVLISFLMTFFNIRLGYWAQNPKCKLFNRPNLIYPGLFALFGAGYNTKDGYLDLSDGGGFENLGLYELLRRRCRFIVASDAGADPEFNFSDLGNAVEKARVDFGIGIRFPNGTYDLEYLIPGTAGDSVFQEKFALAKRGFAIGKITYSEIPGKPKEEGLLIYIKSTITSGLPADIYGYKAKHPTFPDQSTADQFFDEKQFEAYRELGYEITKAAFDDQVVQNEVLKFL